MTVTVRRLSDAERYSAPNHFDCHSLRFQGLGVGAAEALWVGLSHFLPGGSAGPDAGDIEKIYVVTSGELTLKTADGKWILGPMDSVTIPANVERTIVNQSNLTASMLVAMPSPRKD